MFGMGLGRMGLTRLGRGGGAAPPAETTAISVSEIPNNKVFQRSYGQTYGAAVFSGTYSGGAPTGVQVRVITTPGGIEVVPWTTLSSQTIGGGAWSGRLNVPQGGPYLFQARCANNTALTSFGVNQFNVGIVLLCYGQSNMAYMFAFGSMYSSPDQPIPSALSDTYYFDGSAWSAPHAASGLRALLNGVKSAANVPVGVFHSAVSGASIDGLSPGNASGYYNNLITKLTNAGGDAEFILWMQGEGDTGISLESYSSKIDALHDSIATQCGRTKAQMPFFLAGLSRIDASVNTWTTDAAWDSMQGVLFNTAASLPHVYYSHSNADAVLWDGIHWTAGSYERAGYRYARSLSTILGLTSGYPYIGFISSATVDGTTTDVAIQYGIGTDFVPTTGITGFEVSGDNGATWVSATGARVNSTSIRLTHSSIATTSARKMRYLYGGLPVNTGMVKDNSSLSVPLVPSGGALSPTPLAVTPVPTYRSSAATSASTATSSLTGVSVGAATAGDKFVIFGVTINSSGNNPLSVVVTPNSGSPVTATAIGYSVPSAGQTNVYFFSATIPGAATSIDYGLTFTTNPFATPTVHTWTCPSSDLSSTTPVATMIARNASAASLSGTIATTNAGFVVAVTSNTGFGTISTPGSSETYSQRYATSNSGTKHFALDAAPVSTSAGSTLSITYSASGNVALMAASFR